uniref:Uncharacterized protein n=1 Tax=Rhizophora mucronata TaxID=61149 RepID=A0A2P2N7Z2_RHIMU
MNICFAPPNPQCSQFASRFLAKWGPWSYS